VSTILLKPRLGATRLHRKTYAGGEHQIDSGGGKQNQSKRLARKKREGTPKKKKLYLMADIRPKIARRRTHGKHEWTGTSRKLDIWKEKTDPRLRDSINAAEKNSNPHRISEAKKGTTKKGKAFSADQFTVKDR